MSQRKNLKHLATMLGCGELGAGVSEVKANSEVPTNYLGIREK